MESYPSKLGTFFVSTSLAELVGPQWIELLSATDNHPQNTSLGSVA